MIAPHCEQTRRQVSEQAVVLSVGDTTYLDYREIVKKREGYGPQGNGESGGSGGNGLLLHSGLAVEPATGQPQGLLWQKLWNRPPVVPPPADETPEQRKQRRTAAKQAKQRRPFVEKESYRWVEAMSTVEAQVPTTTRVIHVFDREGDIADVFAHLTTCEHTGVVVRAAHNRELEGDSHRLWETLAEQPIQVIHEVHLSATKTRTARTALLAVRFCPVQLKAPPRLGSKTTFPVYAVYAQEIAPPAGEEPVSWMLLTSEPVTTVEAALTILRWYGYRWRVEEYHKVLKSGCQVERYRLAATGMKTLLGFYSVIAVDLLRLTYLQRTQPDQPADTVLSPVQIQVLRAKAPHPPTDLTVRWALEAIARLGGYLEHRRKSPIGIQVLWRGWTRLNGLVEGWQLANQT